MSEGEGKPPDIGEHGPAGASSGKHPPTMSSRNIYVLKENMLNFLPHDHIFTEPIFLILLLPGSDFEIFSSFSCSTFAKYEFHPHYLIIT